MTERTKKIISTALVFVLSVTFVAVSASNATLTSRYAEINKKQEALNESYLSLQYEYKKEQQEIEEQRKKYEELLAMEDTILANMDRLEKADEVYEEYVKLKADHASIKAQYESLSNAFSYITSAVPKETLVRGVLPGILCVGDSLTAGNLGGGGTSYPTIVSNRVSKLLGASIDVINEGRSGWTSRELYYQEVPQINASGWNDKIFVIWMGVNDGWRQFTEKTVAKVDENGNQVYENGVPVYETKGVYDQEASEQTLIRQIEYILSAQRDPESRYLVVGITRPIAPGQEEIDNLNHLDQTMKERFGDKFVDIRNYLRTQALSDAGIRPTESDATLISIGRPPESLMQDHTHFNDVGYTLIGNYIYQKMESLGFFDSAKKIASLY